MKVRKPKYDFTSTDPVWCKEYPEFAQRTNLGCLSLPYLEPYLTRFSADITSVNRVVKAFCSVGRIARV
jgi:hypothetical protein